MTKPGGFTLLETLLAAALSAVVMAGLWSLFHMYERLFTKGQAKVEQAQLVRALVDQLTGDLHSAIPDAPADNAPGLSSVRRFGLFGTSQSLQVDVLQIPASGVADDSLALPGLARSQTPTPQVPELRTVRYLFEPPDAPRDVDPESPAGLVRWEFDWETPLGRNAGPRSAQERQTRQPTKTRIAASSAAKDRSTSAGDPLASTAEGGSMTRVPEVVAMEFRYFDGAAWSDQWSSLARKSLPVAVEIRIGLTSAEEPGQPSHERAKKVQGKENDESRPNADQFPGQTHRVLVYLPTTALVHRVERAGPGPKPIGARGSSYRPLTVPQYGSSGFPGTGGGGARGAFSDQWMRGGR